MLQLPDIPRGSFTWTRQPSHAWIEAPLQQEILTFIKAFEDEHGWVRSGSMEVVERFTDTGVNVHVPLGPTGPEQRRDNFLQRPGLPIVVISCIRDRDSRRFEVATEYPKGNDSPSGAQLMAARASLRAQEVAAR